MPAHEIIGADSVGNPFPSSPVTGRGSSSAADVGHQAHESGPLDRLGNRVLARSVATSLAAAYDAAVTVGQLAQQVEVLVVDEHRPGTDAVDADGVFLDDATS